MPLFGLFLILNGKVQGLCNTGTVEKVGKKEATLLWTVRTVRFVLFQTILLGSYQIKKQDFCSNLCDFSTLWGVRRNSGVCESEKVD